MKTIFNTYVPMESQAQCDRMKQLCIDNGLPIDIRECSKLFYYEKELYNDFCFYIGMFGLWAKIIEHTEVTESEFIELLKEYKNK